MTLFVARASRELAVLVTDRRLTQTQHGVVRVRDRTSNKNLVLCLRDGIVAMAYSGLAQMQRKPTDQWIAEKLSGKSYERGRKPPAIPLFHRGRWFRLSSALRHLVCELQGLPRGLTWKERRGWRQMPFELLAVGFTWSRRGQYRPIVTRIRKPAKDLTVTVSYAPRYFFVPGAVRADSGGLPLARDQLKRLEVDRGAAEPDGAEEAMLELIRQVAVANPAVGPDCLSIVVWPPTTARVRIRYLGLEVTRDRLERGDRGQTEVLVAFGPWLIGTSRMDAPHRRVGSMAVPLDPYRVDLIGPQGAFHMEGQRRPEFR